MSVVIYVGLDDTDTLDHPGTNKLARHLASLVASRYATRMIVRHQLLQDPRVPCTNKNGCAALVLEPLSEEPVAKLVADLRQAMLAWVPAGSDPGLCVTGHVPAEVSAFGARCQKELMTQVEARRLAARFGIALEGLGGTEDGVIGALAAVGLVAPGNDGRVVHRGSADNDAFEIGDAQNVETVFERGVDEIRCLASGNRVRTGVVELGKRLRPNLRGGRVVLFVERAAENRWNAVRIV